MANILALLVDLDIAEERVENDAPVLHVDYPLVGIVRLLRILGLALDGVEKLRGFF